MELNSIISISGTIIGFLAFTIVAVKHRRNSYQKFLFLLFLFSLTYTCFLVFLTEGGAILQYPHFYRTASPFVYAAPIALFLLGKAFGKNKNRFSIRDFALLLIPVLHFAELLPFYLKDAAAKNATLKNIINGTDVLVYNEVSLIPNIWHFRAQLFLGALLMGITFLRTLKYRRNQNRTSRNRNLDWINRISLFLVTSYTLMFLLLIADTDHFPFYSFGTLIYAISLLIVLLSLFLVPFILYGSVPDPVLVKKTPTNSVKRLLTEEELKFKERLEQYFEDENSYLSPGFRQQDLADQLDLSRNELSHLINKVFQKNYNQLLNEKRVEIAMRNLKNSKWEHLSLHGVAREVGFKSRTTFNKAFKQKTGLTPSEYKSA